MNRVDLIVIHCAATYPSMDVDIEWIDRIHRERGFRMVGYHYFITRDGLVQKGREDHVQGAHALNWNRNSLGVCMAGGLKEGTKEPENNFTYAQWDSLERLLTKLHRSYPNAVIKGHNKLKGHESRGCPSFDTDPYVTKLMEQWKLEGLHNPLPSGTILEIEEGQYPTWDEVMNTNRS